MFLKKVITLVKFTLVLVLLLSACTQKNTSITEPNTILPKEVTVHLNDTRQIIRGFGAANIMPWRPDMTAEEINTAFGTGEGQLGFSLLRLRVPYQESEFSLNLATAQAAYALGVTLIASPWSPPPALKTNNNIVGGELEISHYDDYAAHLKSFVDYMSDNGAPLYAISVQNEPDVRVSYESCDWNAAQMVKFIKENAPTIGTKIIAPESYRFRRKISDPILNDSAACANLDILGGHIYGGGRTPYPLAEEKGKEVWMTEYLINSGSPPANLDIDIGWTGAMMTAESINDCMNANMSTYVWWYIVRYYGPIADGTYADKGEVTKKGYVMSQFARFIRPGYYRVECNSSQQEDISITAYTDNASSKIVIVAINISSKAIAHIFTLQNGNAETFTPYLTTETKNCNQENSIAVSDGSFTASLEASSITTFVSN